MTGSTLSSGRSVESLMPAVDPSRTVGFPIAALTTVESGRSRVAELGAEILIGVAEKGC